MKPNFKFESEFNASYSVVRLYVPQALIIAREMSYESFARIVGCSNKIIAKEVQDIFQGSFIYFMTTR